MCQFPIMSSLNSHSLSLFIQLHYPYQWLVHTSSVISPIYLSSYTTYCDLPVIVLTTLDGNIEGGLINSFSIFDSVANGNPLSTISSKSWRK